MKPALLWMEHVLGFEQLWEIAFHTNDVAPSAQQREHGSGLKSVVMWDPHSRREVRQQRAVPARSSRTRRSTSSPRTTAATASSTRRSRSRDIVGAVRGLRAARRRVHADAGQLLRHAAGAARAASASAASTRASTSCASSRSSSTASTPRQYLLQIFLKEAAGLLPRSRGRAVLLRDHPAQGRPGLRRRQLPRAVREHRAAAARDASCSASARCSSGCVAGEVPAKQHTALRDGGGRLRYEECLTRDGFDGPYTILYHRERPHAQRSATAAHGWEIPATADDEPRPLRAPPLPVAGARRAGAAPPIDARVPLLFNDDVVISVVAPRRAPTRSTSRTATATISTSSLEGGGIAALGARRRRLRRRRLRVRAARACCTASCPTSGRSTGCRSSAPAGVGLLAQWRNEVGQLRMDAPYCHRDFRRPAFAGPRDEGLRDLVVKRGGAFHGFRYAARAARRRRLGRHGLSVGLPDPELPAARRARCTCRRRCTARSRRAARSSAASCRGRSTSTPRRSPAPTRTRRSTATRSSSTARGNFTSRKGVGPGSISHHPAGVIARPAPGRLRGQHRRHARPTSSPSCSTPTQPLRATAAARAVEDPGYHASFALSAGALTRPLPQRRGVDDPSLDGRVGSGPGGDARRRLVGRPEGQEDGEGRALAELALDLDLAAVELDEAARERQAEAGALGADAVRLGELLELAEQPRQILARDADAGVGDRSRPGASRRRAPTAAPPRRAA